MKSDDHGPPTDNRGLRLIGANHPDTVEKEAAAGAPEAVAISIGVLQAGLDAPRGASNDNGEALRPTPA